VNRGQLIFTECIINTTNNFIRANGDDSEVIVESGSILNFDQGSIELNDGAHLFIENSIINLDNSKLELEGSSRINLTDNSELNTTGACEIIGSTSEYWYDPAEFYNGPNPPQFGAEICIPGDRITIENSRIDLDNATEIKGKNGSRWDGLFFLNCNNSGENQLECGQLRGSITDILSLNFTNSFVNIECADINNIGQLTIHENSHIYMHYTDYHHNNYGVFAEESAIICISSEIHHNGSNGLTVINSLYPQTILDTNIFENEGIGLDIHNCFYNVSGSRIYDNQKWGYVNLGSVQNLVLYDSEISNNGYAEIASIADCFPHFQSNMYGSPYVFDDEISEDPIDLYLLMALGPVYEPVNVEDLIISTDNETRFFPDFSDFIFNNYLNIDSYLLYLEGMNQLGSEEYQQAYETMKQVVELFPGTIEAKKALALLPYLCKASNENLDQLMGYIDQVTGEELQQTKTEAKAILEMSDKNYAEAIILYEEIINDPPGELEQLLAELNEAFCYFKLVNSGDRDLPQECHHKPANMAEFLEIRQDIRRKILNERLENDVSFPEVNIISCLNYPNPFNPKTIISFQLSGDSGQDDIKLKIYNIKGQMIKTIDCHTACRGEAGRSPEPVEMYNDQIKYSISWNGTDENDRPVTSGVYFYKISVGGRSQAVRKCVLMK